MERYTYRVTLTATAAVSTSVDICAATELEARNRAISMAKAGDLVWEYDGADDSTVEIETCDFQR